MKTAVETVFIGKERQYNRRFLQMCSHYLIEPVACTPASGWEKGQVENQVNLVRERFFTPRLAARSRCSRPPIVSLSPRSLSLALAALLFQPDVERLPCWKLRDRHHEVTPGIADETFDIPFIVAFAGTAIAIPDQVVGQEATEQRCPLACAVRQDLGH